MDINIETINREQREAGDTFKVAIMNELKAHELDVRSFDTGEYDLGISGDVITVGLGHDKVVQSAVGEHIVWKSLTARHDSPKSNRRMVAQGYSTPSHTMVQSPLTGASGFYLPSRRVA